MHPSFGQPWTGSLQMWPYGRPPPPQQAFTAFPQYGGPFGGVPGGYGSTAPSSYVYGGATPSIPTFQGNQGHPTHYQVPALVTWNPTYGGAWNRDSLVQSFNTMSLTQPPSSEWYAHSGAGSHMTADAGTLLFFIPFLTYTFIYRCWEWCTPSCHCHWITQFLFPTW